MEPRVSLEKLRELAFKTTTSYDWDESPHGLEEGALIDAAVDEIYELREAFLKYACHLRDCQWLHKSCTCGRGAALARLCVSANEPK